VVYITTPAIPSCFLAFFSDPYSLFEIFIFLSFYDNISCLVILRLLAVQHLKIIGVMEE